MKISESPSKIPNPGFKSVWRIYDRRGKSNVDLMSLDNEKPQEMHKIVLRHPHNHTKFRVLDQEEILEIEPLLVDIFRDGKLVYEFPAIDKLRDARRADVRRLDAGVRRIMNPHIYHVSLTQELWDLKQTLVSTTINH